MLWETQREVPWTSFVDDLDIVSDQEVTFKAHVCCMGIQVCQTRKSQSRLIELRVVFPESCVS